MSEKKSGQIFAAAQQIGKSLFLPIAVLPPAGILLGIGSSFTNSTTIATYHLEGILHEGSIMYSIMLMLSNAGNAIFANLALIFALAVALGMAKSWHGEERKGRRGHVIRDFLPYHAHHYRHAASSGWLYTC